VSTPILPEDIRKGDLIRRERVSEWAGEYSAIEFTARRAGTEPMSGWEFFLLDRPKPPVVLPTEPGVYLDIEGDIWEIRQGSHTLLCPSAAHSTHFKPADYAPFTKLEPVADTAKRVAVALNEKIASEIEKRPQWYTKGTAGTIGQWATDLAAEFGVTS
jgi:hypothetical protein